MSDLWLLTVPASKHEIMRKDAEFYIKQYWGSMDNAVVFYFEDITIDGVPIKSLFVALGRHQIGYRSTHPGLGQNQADSNDSMTIILSNVNPKMGQIAGKSEVFMEHPDTIHFPIRLV